MKVCCFWYYSVILYISIRKDVLIMMQKKKNNKGYKINTNGTVRKAGKKHRLNDAEEYAKLNGYDSYKEMEEIELNR